MAKRRKRPARPVDRAMREVRLEKNAVRKLWIETVRNYGEQYTDTKELLYVTLPGAEGLEIELLVEEDLIEVTEIGTIAQSSMTRFAAVEASPLAVGALQIKFPGLKIFETNIRNLVRGDGLLAYPTGEEKNCCRARIVNLDLDEPLASSNEDDPDFPVLALVQKLGQMHAAAPRLDWCLCLTLHGEVHWTTNISEAVRDFLCENFARADQFSSHARTLLGQDLHDAILNGENVDFSRLSREEQQKILMMFVPKKISEMVRQQHWRLDVQNNLRYGRPGHAPMVTWIIHFKHERRAHGTPDAIYLQNVNGVLSRSGVIDPEGGITADIN